MEHYPSRDWERLYRDVFSYDRVYHFLCAPSDTHNCLLPAHVKNDVITRLGPSFGYGKAEDIYGNKASSRWDPRICQKGLAMVNRIYGPRRIKHPMVRKGFKQWVEAGFPRDEEGRVAEQYRRRGEDEWVKADWDEATRLVAEAVSNIARTYSGPEGQGLLRRQDYDSATVEATGGAGTQVLKARGGMPLLGATRIMGMFRFSNSLALLDAKVRGLDPAEARGGRMWDSYSWHTDLPPGHPMVTGQQTIDWDLADAENAELVIPWGMNWISTKMPDSHWLTEAHANGTKVVTITVEYSSVANKSDEVLVIRPGSDGALALGMVHVILKEDLYDEDYVKSFTDLPLLVRTDTLRLLSPEHVIEDYRPRDLEHATVLGRDQSPLIAAEQPSQIIPEQLRRQWGDFMVWDMQADGPLVISRDEVGRNFAERQVEPAPFAEHTVTLKDGTEVEVSTVGELVRQYVMESFSPEQVAQLTWAPAGAIESLARQIAHHRGKTLIAVGMGPNHFFNNDCKDRGIFLLCALTHNIGLHGRSCGGHLCLREIPHPRHRRHHPRPRAGAWQFHPGPADGAPRAGGAPQDSQRGHHRPRFRHTGTRRGRRRDKERRSQHHLFHSHADRLIRLLLHRLVRRLSPPDARGARSG